MNCTVISFAKIWLSTRKVVAVGALSTASIAGIAAAQGVDSFDIPDNIQILGQMDPNMRTATARVNGNIITGTDVDHRVALITSANEQELSAEEMQTLRLQVLRNLVDETLQVQEAAAQEMEVTTEDVDQAYKRFASERFPNGEEDMAKFLASIGSSPGTLKRQIQGEIAWDRLLRRNVVPFVNVSSDEVGELYDRLQQSMGSTEYRIGEIYLPATPTTQETVLANGQQIMEQLRNGGSFVAYARQFSKASTAATGGDLGWIRLPQLQNQTLEEAAAQMVPGQIVGPLEIPGGYSLLLLIDKRQVGMADPRDAMLSLKQISFGFPQGTSEAKARSLANDFANAVANMNGCGDANEKAAAIGATTVDNDQIAVRALPEALQATLLQLNVGQATPPFGDLSEGVRVLMLCGRDDPQTQAGPSRDQLMSQLEDERINRRAQRYLRDLRRDAVIEYN